MTQNIMGEKKKLTIKYRGNDIIQSKYVNKFTRNEIKDTVQQISNGMKKRNIKGLIMVTIKYPETKSSKGWRSGYLTEIGKPIAMYDHSDSDEFDDEPKYYKEFRVYWVRNGEEEGKKDDANNDCLYTAFKEVFHGDFLFKDPESLKKFLKVKRTDGVSIDKLDLLEKKLEIRINVTGDHIRSSTLKGHSEINLRLTDGHYSVDKDTMYTTKGISKWEKKPLIISLDDEVYNGKKKWTITKEQLSEWRRMPSTCKYVIIPIDGNHTLEETYDEFVKDADILKAETMGLINLYKTGTNMKTASKLFERFSRSIHADEIKQDEAEWIQNASVAALIFAEKYEGPLYEYDVCSMYPSIMSDNYMMFPVKRGRFDVYTQQQFVELKFILHGIYRCKITQSGNRQIDRLFRFNNKNYYTHFDVKRAKELNLSIEMIEDSKANALIYSRDCLINGNMLFYKYVQILFSLKERKIAPKRSKGILNILWGYLTRNDIYTQTISDEETFEIPEDGTLTSLYPLDDNRIIVNYYPNNKKMFVTNFARIKPFLLARGRSMISTLIQPHNKHVIRSHTDSILSTIPIEFPKSKYTRGSIVLKRSSEHVIIHNNIKMEWN